MPLYEYRCETCGHRFESIRKVSDPLPDGCPKCGGAVQKLQSAPAFQFKGSGWYITDYARKDGDKNRDKDTGEPAAKSGSDGAKDGAKSDSKEAAKADTKTETKTDSKAPAATTPKTDAAAS